MREHRIPKRMIKQSLDYFRAVYKSRVMYEEKEILGTMPPDMRMVFARQLYLPTIQCVPFFRGISIGVLHSLCAITHPFLAVRSQVIYREGSVGKEMYLVLNGELEITARGAHLGFLSDGAFFGETVILESDAAAEVRRRTVTAVVDCRLAYISKDAVNDLGAAYPELALKLAQCGRIDTKVNRKGRKYLQTMLETKSKQPSTEVQFERIREQLNIQSKTLEKQGKLLEALLARP